MTEQHDLENALEQTFAGPLGFAGRHYSTEELRQTIARAVDSTLEAPWVVRRFMTTEYLQLLRAMRRYWMEDDGTQLAVLNEILKQEP